MQTPLSSPGRSRVGPRPAHARFAARFWAAVAALGALLAVTRAAEAAEAALDRYGGDLRMSLPATGFFRAERVAGQWWLVTPDGHPFFSVGVNALSFNGTATKGGICHYGDTCRRAYPSRQAWAEAQIARCQAWGINTVGCWSDWQLFRGRLAYTVNLDIGASNWQSGAWADLFAPDFVARVRATMHLVAAPLRDDPFLIGYYLGNEMKWGPDHRGGHLLDEFFSRPPGPATKQALVAFLQQRYGTLAALQDDFTVGAPVRSWDELSGATALTARPTVTAAATRQAWAEAVAERFFAVTAAELKAADPNHLDLGVRFISQMVPPGVLRVAGRYVDVMTINYYDIGNWVLVIRGLCPDYLPVDGDLAQHYQVGGRPILVSEWGYRAADSGHPNSWPPFYPTLPDQAARAAAYDAFARRVLACPWFVGQHWFLWADQPKEGRFDGENNNFGLVNLDDEPYGAVVERSAALARLARDRLLDRPGAGP